MLHKVKYYRYFFYNCGAFLYDVFLIFLFHNFCNDDMLSSVFWSKWYGIVGFNVPIDTL